VFVVDNLEAFVGQGRSQHVLTQGQPTLLVVGANLGRRAPGLERAVMTCGKLAEPVGT